MVVHYRKETIMMNTPYKTLQLTSKELERALRELESTPELPESVNHSPYEIIDLITFLFRRGVHWRNRREQTFSKVAQQIFPSKDPEKSRSVFNYTFMVRKRSSTRGDYRKEPSTEEFERFVHVLFSVWDNEWSPHNYDPPLDLDQTMTNLVAAYGKKPWENIAILINLLHGVEWITLDDIRYLMGKGIQYNDDTTLEVIQIILKERS